MKKIFTLTLLLLLPIITFADSVNVELEQFLSKTRSEISDIKTEKDPCPEWKEQLNNFLHLDIDSPSLDSIIQSFPLLSRWNYCFKRDLKKIKVLEVIAMQKRYDIIKRCESETKLGTGTKLGKIIKIINTTKDKRQKFGEQTADYFWDNDIYWDWGKGDRKCDEDLANTFNEKLEKLKWKFEPVYIGWWAWVKENVSWGAGGMFTFSDEEKKEMEEKGAKKTRLWFIKNFNSYISFLPLKLADWNWTGSILDSTKELMWKWWNWISWLRKDFEVFIGDWESYKEISNKIDLAKEMQQVSDANIELIKEKHSIINIDESGVDEIIGELEELEKSIVASNWESKKGQKIKNSDRTLRRFISVIMTMLEEHNTNETRRPFFKYNDY